MKKLNIFLGIAAPLYFFLVSNLMLCMKYSEKYSYIQNFLLISLPALPGVMLAFMLIRNSLKEFFQSFGIFFFTSVFVFIGIVLLHKAITGYEELSLGGGILLATMYISYIISLTASVVSFADSIYGFIPSVIIS